MKEFLTKTFLFLLGAIYLPAVFALYFVLFRSFGMLGVVPASYFSSAGMIGIILCKNKFFLAGLLLCVLLLVSGQFFANKHPGNDTHEARFLDAIR